MKEVIKELAASFISRESNRQSLITVTDVELLSKGAKAVILITVLPEEKENDAVELLRRRVGDFRQYVHENSRIARLPFFDVKIDYGEKNRQRIDEIAGRI